jgi:hypothetical protein
MHPLLEINKEDVKKLDDSQARELVARLGKASLKAQGFPESAVTWGGDQRASDGGVDVCVSFTATEEVCGFVPNSETVFQVKAVKDGFTSARIKKEIGKNGALISSLKEKKGAYILVSTKDDCSNKTLGQRKQALADCLPKEVMSDFYDSQRLSDAANEYPQVALWLRHVLNKPQWWRPYEGWAYKEVSSDGEYFFDDQTLIQRLENGESLTFKDAINQIRQKFQESGKSIRIVGLSGSGKTRFVQALFDERIETEAPTIDCNYVFYSDTSDSPKPEPLALLECINDENKPYTLIVDNCDQSLNSQLTNFLEKHQGTKVNLITVDYDIKDDIPEGTSSCYRIERQSDAVLEKILKKQYPILSQPDTETVIRFSEGNVRVAYALASTAKEGGELATLRANQLFERLFFQRNGADRRLQQCAEALSLVYSFDAEDTSPDSELALLSSIPGFTVTDLYSEIAELERRQLVQTRGKWKAILPHAIANKLAMKALQDYPIETIVSKLVEGGLERVAESFSHRLSYLHESKEAKSIVESWLKPDGYLGKPAKFSDKQWKIFENIAPICQRETLDVLLRASKDPEFISIKEAENDWSNLGRIHKRCIDLLRHLAYEPEFFDEALMELVDFELSVNKQEDYHPAFDDIHQFFYLRLSGTMAPPSQRMQFVKRLFQSGDSRKEKLALSLADAALETRYFSTTFLVEFGALKRTHGWSPKTYNDIFEYYRCFVAFLEEIGSQKNKNGAEARNIFAKRFRGLWTLYKNRYPLQDKLFELARAFFAIDGWSEGFNAIKDTILYDGDKLEKDSLESLHSLRDELVPKDLASKIYVDVLSNRHADFSYKNEDVKIAVRRLARKLEELGKQAASNESFLVSFLPELLSNQSSTLFQFGYAVALNNAHPAKLMVCIYKAINKLQHQALNINFVFGFILGWNELHHSEVSNFLDNVINDEFWVHYVPRFQCATGFDKSGVERMLCCLKNSVTVANDFVCLIGAHALNTVSIKELDGILLRLSIKENGLPIVLEVLYGLSQCIDNKEDDYVFKLKRLCLKYVEKIDFSKLDPFSDENSSFYIQGITKFGISDVALKDISISILRHIIKSERSRGYLCRPIGKLLMPFFLNYPFDALNICFKDYIEGEKTYRGGPIFQIIDSEDTYALKFVPKDDLIAWCQVSPEERFTFAARFCDLIEFKQNREAIGVTDVAKKLLELAPNPEAVLTIFMSRFQPNSWWGSLSQTLKNRIILLDDLKTEKNKSLNFLIEQKRKDFDKIIADNKREEDKRNEEKSSFE